MVVWFNGNVKTIFFGGRSRYRPHSCDGGRILYHVKVIAVQQ